jgi:hypothetical protein
MDDLEKEYIELIINYPNKSLENKIKNNKLYESYSHNIKNYLLKYIDKNHFYELRSALAMKLNIRNKKDDEIYNYIYKYINEHDICDPIILYIFNNWDSNSTNWNKSTLVYDLVGTLINLD